MSSRNLPGFLRRTRRRDFEEESDDDDYFSSDNEGVSTKKSSSNSEDGSVADTNQTNGGVSSEENDEEFIAPIQAEAETKAETELETAVISAEAESPPNDSNKMTSSFRSFYNGSAATANAEDSTRSLGMSSLGSPRLIDRKLNYREIKFDSVIGADTVKMADLRKLGWNGIPVSSLF